MKGRDDGMTVTPLGSHPMQLLAINSDPTRVHRTATGFASISVL